MRRSKRHSPLSGATCCSVHSLVDISSAVWAAQRPHGRSWRVAQQPRMRRIGVLMSTAADDSEGQARIAAFLQGPQQLGWTAGRNVQIEYRWTAGAPERARSYARELAALAPDVIVTGGASYVAALQATRTVPIVFATATDPVGGGFLVTSLARPGGNVTGVRGPPGPLRGLTRPTRPPNGAPASLC
jgi:hypothetical protein